METENQKANIDAQLIEKLYMENTLLRVAGALFCHDQRRAAKRTEIIQLNRGPLEKHIAIRPDPEYGQPGPLAHKIFVALIKKHSEYGRPVPEEISFTKREIMRMIGRAEWGGSASAQLSRAIEEIRNTSITAHFKRADIFYEERFHLFSRVLIERRISPQDPIERCAITIAKPIIDSLNDDHFTCLNHSLMQSLETIGQALYMRLFFHFANLHDGASGKRLAFPKRYNDICNEWLGGLTVLAHKSKIISEQLGSHLAQLVSAGFLASYTIEKARTGIGLVITFRPGAVFFQDYDRFYRRRSQGELQWHFHADRKAINEPLKVAYLFAEKRIGQSAASIAFVPSKDVETAKQFLAKLPFDQIPAFIDYALAEARRTNFDVQTLGGIKQYLTGYLTFQAGQKAARAAQAAWKAKEKAEAERMAFDSYRRAQAVKLFDTLPADQQSEIEDQARTYAANFSGSLRDRMLASRRAHLTLTRYGDRLATFDQWRHQIEHRL
jgi:hypothetical protein